jgi:hypothetical protein
MESTADKNQNEWKFPILINLYVKIQIINWKILKHKYYFKLNKSFIKK